MAASSGGGGNSMPSSPGTPLAVGGGMMTSSSSPPTNPVSPLARPPPPYFPPPCVGPVTPPHHQQNSPPIPTLATAVIFEGPKLHPQPQVRLKSSFSLVLFCPQGYVTLVSLSTLSFFLLYYTMILQRIRIIMGDAGFEPGMGLGLSF